MTHTAPRRSTDLLPAPVPERVRPTLGSRFHSWRRIRPLIALSEAENARRFKELKGHRLLGSAGAGAGGVGAARGPLET